MTLLENVMERLHTCIFTEEYEFLSELKRKIQADEEVEHWLRAVVRRTYSETQFSSVHSTGLRLLRAYFEKRFSVEVGHKLVYRTNNHADALETYYENYFRSEYVALFERGEELLNNWMLLN